MITDGKNKPRRSTLEICMNMMQILRGHGQLGPTKIMYMANLSWEYMIKYLNIMISSKLIETTSDNHYMLTQRGLECVALLEQGMLMIGPLMEVFPPVSKPLSLQDLLPKDGFSLHKA